MAKRKPKTVTITLDPDLHDRLTEILNERGVALEDYVTLHLSAFANQRVRPFALDDTFNFGKYRDSPVELVVRSDPSYITWLVANSNTARFGTDVLELLDEITAGQWEQF